MATQPTIREEILDTEDMKKIFVGGILKEVTDDELKTAIEGHGVTVTECQVIRKDDKDKVFAFVTLDSSESVDELLLKKAVFKLKDRVVHVHRSLPKTIQGSNEKTKKMFIRNIPNKGVTSEMLKTYFEERHPKVYGEIESIEFVMKKDEKGQKTDEMKGYGFMTVTTEDMADKMAIQHASFKFGEGENIRDVQVMKSVPKDGSGAGGRGGGRGGRGRGGSP